MAASPRLANLFAALTLGLHDETVVAVAAATGLSGNGAAALIALDEFLDGENVGRLADVLGLTHSGAVRLAAQLEDRGLVRRTEGADRRQVLVQLTAKGRRAAARAAAARTAVVQEAVAGIDRADAEILERLLADLVAGRVRERLRRRVEEGTGGAWWCRMCDLQACGRPDGRCPAERAARSL